MSLESTRREMLRNSVALGTVGLGAAAALTVPLLGQPVPEQSKKKGENEKEPEVTATEDLMREHGVIRRALLVYYEVIPKLRQNPGAIDASALQQTAKLFRTFGEDYHERMLEEQHIFPLIRKQGPELARYADILTQQHQRGREITDYILAHTGKIKMSSLGAGSLARVMEPFVLMYQNHAAREDTIVFPAWKKNFTDKQLDEIGDQF
ncbi:MAG: hemerythrin domain-containing protein, partial [Betaproteobacteria bacterium]